MRASVQTSIHRLLSGTEWDMSLTLHWVTFIFLRLPQGLGDTVQDLQLWLHRWAVWCPLFLFFVAFAQCGALLQLLRRLVL